MSYKRQYMIGACIYLGQFLAGYGTGWTAPIVPKLQDPDKTPLDDVLTDAQVGWIGSIMYLGCIVGPYASGYLSNTIGRKPCFFIGGGISVIGFVILALAKSLAIINTGRIVCGLGVGILFIMNLVYLGEIASPAIRGSLLTLTGFSTALGTFLAYTIGPFVSYPVAGWIPAGLCALYIIGVYFLPESPVYQAYRGDQQAAASNLEWLGRKEDIDNVIAASTEDQKSKISQLTEMFTVQTNRKALFIVLSLLILQQLSGFLAVVFFVTTIFDKTRMEMESHISTIIIGATQVFAASITPFIVERTGRKSLLLVTTAVCAISLATLGIYFYLMKIKHPAADKLSWLSLTSLIAYFMFYFTGFGIIPGTFIGEMFTANVSSFAATFVITISWIFGFGVSSAFGYMVPAWGSDVTFWIYSGACIVAFVFSLIVVPETKGKTLLEVRELLKN